MPYARLGPGQDTNAPKHHPSPLHRYSHGTCRPEQQNGHTALELHSLSFVHVLKWSTLELGVEDKWHVPCALVTSAAFAGAVPFPAAGAILNTSIFRVRALPNKIPVE